MVDRRGDTTKYVYASDSSWKLAEMIGTRNASRHGVNRTSRGNDTDDTFSDVADHRSATCAHGGSALHADTIRFRPRNSHGRDRAS